MQIGHFASFFKRPPITAARDALLPDLVLLLPFTAAAMGWHVRAFVRCIYAHAWRRRPDVGGFVFGIPAAPHVSVPSFHRCQIPGIDKLRCTEQLVLC